MKSNTDTTLVEQVQAGIDKVTAIHQEMNRLTPITPEERATNQKHVGPRHLRLLPNRVEEARQNRKLVAAILDLPKLEHDAALTAVLAVLLNAVDKLRQDVNDTLIHVGSAAVIAAASANSCIKMANKTARRLSPTELRKARSSSPPAEQTPAPATSAPTALPVETTSTTRQAA